MGWDWGKWASSVKVLFSFFVVFYVLLYRHCCFQLVLVGAESPKIRWLLDVVHGKAAAAAAG